VTERLDTLKADYQRSFGRELFPLISESQALAVDEYELTVEGATKTELIQLRISVADLVTLRLSEALDVAYCRHDLFPGERAVRGFPVLRRDLDAFFAALSRDPVLAQSFRANSSFEPLTSRLVRLSTTGLLGQLLRRYRQTSAQSSTP